MKSVAITLLTTADLCLTVPSLAVELGADGRLTGNCAVIGVTPPFHSLPYSFTTPAPD